MRAYTRADILTSVHKEVNLSTGISQDYAAEPRDEPRVISLSVSCGQRFFGLLWQLVYSRRRHAGDPRIADGYLPISHLPHNFIPIITPITGFGSNINLKGYVPFSLMRIC